MNFYQQLGFLVFGSRLKRLADTFIGDVNRIYKKHRIHFDASWFPVFYILSEKKEVSIKEISDELNVSHSAISQLVGSLQQKGLIRSLVSKTDARHRSITFTAKGEKLLQQIQPVWDALEKAMEKLTNESAQSRKILLALTALEKNIQHKTVFERVEKILK
ncbi:MAG TPA: MarR family winged helix-turn-helix transcriptional regulator [Parafilimonas sp.]|nr:MarR family winged helix-turn-helix transcriptional regulator [Parafilimonas sp.]